MPSVYTNFVTGATAIAGVEPPLTDNITARPIAYMSATVRFVVPFTGTGGALYVVQGSLPTNFIARNLYVDLVGAASNTPTGVGFSVGSTSGGVDYVAATTFTGDGTIVAAILPAFNLIMSANPAQVGRPFFITPTATTSGTGTARLYCYFTGVFVDPVDVHVNT